MKWYQRECKHRKPKWRQHLDSYLNELPQQQQRVIKQYIKYASPKFFSPDQLNLLNRIIHENKIKTALAYFEMCKNDHERTCLNEWLHNKKPIVPDRIMVQMKIDGFIEMIDTFGV